MRLNSNKPAAFALLGMLAIPMSAGLSAQVNNDPNIVVTANRCPI
nr:hypothetical protein [Novosphingobium ginsenosidimutans]